MVGRREGRVTFSADELLAELHRRTMQKAGASGDMLAGLHAKQRAFVEDKSVRKAGLCSRRAGKSWGLASWYVLGGQSDPGGLSVYITRSKGDARRIMEPAFNGLNEAFKLGARWREQDGQLYWTLPNGHSVWLAGCKNKAETGKFRGPKYRRAAVDEAQEFPGYLETLIEDSLDPALMDKRGELALTGTPHPVPAGYFYAATTGDGGAKWSTHEWTVLDNPFIPHAEAWLLEKLKRNGWDATHPTYRREWLGEWVLDLGALIYPYSGEINTFQDLPSGDGWTYAIGVDLGASESVKSTAFVVACCRRGHPEVYVLRAEKREGLIPSAVAAHVERYLREFPRALVVVDEGGLGKGYADEMRKSYGIPVVAAEKTRKRGFQELVSGDLLSGVIKIHPWNARELVDEIQILQWDEAREGADERFEDHAADAFLYAVRALRPFYSPEEEEPAPGSPEAEKRAWAKIRREAQERARKSSRRWRGGPGLGS
jgi:hypothetical protein